MKYLKVNYNNCELIIPIKRILYITRIDKDTTHICVHSDIYWNIKEDLNSILDKIKEVEK